MVLWDLAWKVGLPVAVGILVCSTIRRMAPKEIIIAGAPAPLVPVMLVDKKYQARAPKKSLLLAMMMKLRAGGSDPEELEKTMGILLRKMFGKEIAPEVQARLDDENDDLDIDHIMMLANKLIEASTADPTGSASASSATR